MPFRGYTVTHLKGADFLMSGSGTGGTIRTLDDLLYAFRDNPPPKSITPRTVRDLIATLAARCGVTSVTEKTGPVQSHPCGHHRLGAGDRGAPRMPPVGRRGSWW